MYYEQKFLKRAHFNNNTWLITLILVKPRAHNERTFAQTSAHLRKRAHISEVPISTFVCHNSAPAENCKTYTFHDHEHKFKRAEKSVLFKIQGYKQIRKVAAHQNPREIADPIQRYHCLGNTLANDVAIETCLHMEPTITSQLPEIHKVHEQQEAKLKQLFDLHLKLQTGRAQAMSSHETQFKDLVEETAQTVHLDDAIQQWRPQGQLWKPPDVVTRQWLEFSAWGQQVSFVVLQWILNLSWGATNEGPNGFQMGLSWTEVALSLCLSLGAWLPIRRRNADEVETLIHPLDTAMAKSWGVTLSEMSQNAYLLVIHRCRR